jgi:hypothetical protein
MATDTVGDALLLLSKVSSNLDKKISKLEESIMKTSFNGKGKDQIKDKRLVKKSDPVVVTNFGRAAEKDLKNAFVKDKKEKDDPMKGGGGGFIKKLIGPALLILGGLSALVAGLTTDGPLKGLFKILSKGGIIGGVKLFQKLFSKQVAAASKLFTKLLPKNLFGNIVKAAKGFLGKIGKFLLAPFKMLSKGGAKGLFGKITGMLMKFIKPVLSKIPGIGSIISFSFAVNRFKQGQVVGGLIDVASGIASFFPGIGTALAIGLDVLNAFLDVKSGKDKKVEGKGSFSIKDFFKNIVDKILNNFPIKNLLEFYSGVGMVFTGNFKEGFTKMAFAVPFMKPLADFLFGEQNEEGVREGGAALNFKKFFGGIKNKMLGMLLKMVPEKILGVSVRSRVAKLLGFEAGKIEDEPNAGPDYAQPELTEEQREKIKEETKGMSVSERMKYIANMQRESKEDFSGDIVNQSREEFESTNKTLINTLDKNTFISQNKVNMKVSQMHYDELVKNNQLLTEILQKINAGNTVVNNNNSSTTNVNSNGSLVKTFRESYAYDF